MCKVIEHFIINIINYFLHSYVTLSDPGTVQLINMAYFIHLYPSPYPELKCIRINSNIKVG